MPALGEIWRAAPLASRRRVKSPGEENTLLMERLGIKITLLVIALASGFYWAQPPHLTGGPILAACSVLWALMALASFRSERAEDWSYRLSSFLGVTMATVEGISGMLGLQSRPGLLWMACVHGAAFFLAVVGRYQKVSARRPRRSFD